jgi:outer membrane lipoprotein LolB
VPGHILPWLLLLSLGACSGVTVKERESPNVTAYQQRAAQIAGFSEWGLAGRISLDDGDEGGSGKLSWSVVQDIAELNFHAAMGRGAWNLKIGPALAVLTEANGEMQSAASVNALIQQRIGWPIPVDALQWWVRGLSAPGATDRRVIDSEGLLVHLDQFGWSVEFSRYGDSSGIAMPKKLNATMGEYRVKLAIGRWQIPGNDDGQN